VGVWESFDSRTVTLSVRRLVLQDAYGAGALDDQLALELIDRAEEGSR
jgi:hypothetical protein